MKITADLKLCIGAGQCVMHAPDLFTQSDDTGQVIVLKPEAIADEDREAAQMAVWSCPVKAVTVTE